MTRGKKKKLVICKAADKKQLLLLLGLISDFLSSMEFFEFEDRDDINATSSIGYNSCEETSSLGSSCVGSDVLTMADSEVVQDDPGKKLREKHKIYLVAGRKKRWSGSRFHSLCIVEGCDSIGLSSTKSKYCRYHEKKIHDKSQNSN